MTTRSLRIAVAALTATAALTLTACGGGDTKKEQSAPASAGAEENSDAGTDGTADSNDGTDSDGGTDDSGEEQATADKGDACAPDAVKVEVRQVSSPARHVVLVATNTSSTLCYAYGFPFLRFDQDQASAAAVEESRTQDRTALKPGKSAYAGVLTSATDGSGGPGRDVKELSVTFQNAKGEPVGTPARVPAPGGKLHVDDTARTSYWVYDESAALKF
ncbi:hypothetical protein GCM10010218_26490 [Streptomyces mashuensis]|uniref:DUF4232 domain-containing protein n=1 Tax=Streptomyces mashuensis TaxID=33904 RepID=A0A919B2P5_9ACTN|nr:DUF4232 domain-containing protein [Streptomyces mashuensis]GHF43900.1 hypothetical protein GCM10010218_26490 [Streptomyces mashuensis]